MSPLALFAVLFLVGWLPLLGGPRYEAALVAGLIGPSWAGVSVAWRLRRAWPKMPAGVFSGRELLLVGLRSGATHAAAVLTAAAAHLVRGPACEPAAGFALLALGPGLGIVWASCLASVLTGLLWLPRRAASQWGSRSASGLGTFSRSGIPFRVMLFRAGIALAVGLACPLGSALLELVAFYATPVVYAFDPFVGYFGGPLYDVMEYPLERLLLLRTGTMASAGALACALAPLRLWRHSDGSGTWKTSARGAAASWVAAVALLGASLLHASFETRLGLASTASSIQAELPGRAVSGPCRVVFDASIPLLVGQRTAEECRQHLRQLGGYFGLDSHEPVTVYLFASAQQKGRLMGASNTYIAKPWRREVYLQPQPYPHPVLGHELAHVVAGELAPGPLHVALAGVVPDPGRIEGFAVAAAPREHSEATVHEWAAAMERLGLLPPAERLFSLGFFGNSAVRSYTAAGSFIDFLHEKYGSDVLAAWYGGENLETLTGERWVDLEGRWHEHLRVRKLSPEFLRLAEARFLAPALFDRTCPHAVDRALASAERLCPVNAAAAQQRLHLVERLAPGRPELMWFAPGCAVRRGELALAEQAFAFAMTRRPPERWSPQQSAQLLQAWGDVAWAGGHVERARELFARAAEQPMTRDQARGLAVRRWALSDAGPRALSALTKLLAAGPENGPQAAAPELGRWLAAGEEPGLAAYLLGRLRLAEGDAEQAAELLERAVLESQPIPSVPSEAARLLVQAGCLVGEPRLVELGLERLELLDAPEVMLLESRRLSDRCLD